MYGYISYQRQIRLYKTDLMEDIDSVGLTMKSIMENIWQNEGEQRAIEVMNNLKIMVVMSLETVWGVLCLSWHYWRSRHWHTEYWFHSVISSCPAN